MTPESHIAPSHPNAGGSEELLVQNETAARRRPAVAVLIDYMTLFGGGYEKEVRTAFDAAARARGVDLFCVYGRAIAQADAMCAAHNAIYEAIGPSRIDGVIALSASLSGAVGADGLRSFLERYRPLALCSVGVSAGSIPSVLVDNCVGMQTVMLHLIREHGARRIAFIAGPPDNPDARARLLAYREALGLHGLSFDPALVAIGDFVRRSGHVAMAEILSRTGKPDAVVAANDSMALGAIAALRARGLRAPRDVLVTGFDDLEQARLGDPPLTTVGQPLSAMADRAIELVLQQMSGNAVPVCSMLPAEFIARQSCGCNLRGAKRSCQPTRAERADSRQLRCEVERLKQVMCRDLSARSKSGQAAELLTALARELDGQPRAFLSALEEQLAELDVDNEHHQRLQMTITRLREELRDATTPELEDLWNDARAMVALSNTQTQVQRRLEHDEVYHRLIEHGDQLSTAPDIASLKAILEKTLPALGVRTAYISRHADSGATELEPLVSLKDGSPDARLQGRFAAHHLYPPETELSDERFTAFVFPLVFEAQNLGIAVFECSADANGYQVIRDQIGAALHSVMLHDEIVARTTQHERSIQEQERLATAKRIQSLSVLAGGVAHDLNNVLGPLVALPDMILGDLERWPAAEGTRLREVRTDLETMRAAALRATQTIKDLLTLSRQGQVAKTPLDLNAAIASWGASDLPRGGPEAARRTNVVFDLCSERLFIQGSESHVIRAASNLVNNAIEASACAGEVRIATRRVTVVQPIQGYETVEPGQYAAVAVSDAGKGIVAADIARIFEPFFSSKQLGDQSGSGLGLAIVHGVVKEHGGFINVESAPDRGTTFTLYFPLVPAAPQAEVKHPKPARGSAKILVVDDEPIQLRTSRRILTYLGYEVDTLTSGRDACRVFAAAHRGTAGPGLADTAPAESASPYDLAIVDMLLNEDRDGLDVLQEIRCSFPDQKVVIASGHASTERATLAVSRGIKWLAKPYTADALALAVREALGANEDEQRPSSSPAALP